jgi:hypothetical protein
MNKTIVMRVVIPVLIFGFAAAGCKVSLEPGVNEGYWEHATDTEATGFVFNHYKSRAGISYSVDGDNYVTVNVGSAGERWDTDLRFTIQGTVGRTYEFELEAWTDGGTRSLDYWIDEGTVNKGTFTINRDRHIYIVTSDYPNTKQNLTIVVQCGDAVGTFHIKLLSAKALVKNS